VWNGVLNSVDTLQALRSHGKRTCDESMTLNRNSDAIFQPG